MDVSRLETLAVLGVVAMLILTSGIIFFIVTYQKKIMMIRQQQEKALTEAAIKAEEEERGRIAAELHDDVGAMLASVKLNMHQAEEDGSGSAAFGQSQQLIEKTIDKVRQMSRSLQPTMLHHLGLSRALQAFFDMFPQNSAIGIHYVATPLPQMQEDIALGIYRIIQELVNNTLKHARASDIWLQHEISDNLLCFRFSHNGRGITEEHFQEYIYKKDAMGLKNIINRLNVLNGSISFEQADDRYYILIKIPV